MFNRNSVVVCVTGVEDFGARFIWNKRTGKTTKCTYVPAQNVEGTFEECVLKVSAHTIEQYIEQFDEGKWHGKLALVLPHNVHLRACQVRRLYVKDEIHDADEILAEIVDSCSWEMSESHKSALSDYIVQFVQMMDETGLDIQILHRVNSELLHDGANSTFGQFRSSCRPLYVFSRIGILVLILRHAIVFFVIY